MVQGVPRISKKPEFKFAANPDKYGAWPPRFSSSLSGEVTHYLFFFNLKPISIHCIHSNILKWKKYQLRRNYYGTDPITFSENPTKTGMIQKWRKQLIARNNPRVKSLF